MKIHSIKIFSFLILLVFANKNIFAQQMYESGMVSKVSNLTWCTPEEIKVITHELNKLTPAEAKNNPDYGVISENSPCADCIELIQKRTEYIRYYVTKGTNGGKFLLSQGYFPINYRDENGFLRAINDRLKPNVSHPKLYEAPKQEWPTKIDFENKFSSLSNSGKEFKFNQNLRLIHKDAIGNSTVLATADWSDYTIGSDGTLITNIFPNVDLKIRVFEGKLKTDFIVKQSLGITSGWIVIEDDLSIPDGLFFSTTDAILNADGQWMGDVDFAGKNSLKFTVRRGYALDNELGVNPQTIMLGYKFTANKFEIYLPCNWLADPIRQFPLTIDPLVQTSGTNVAINGQGAGYDAACVPNGCNYFLSVNTPANVTITNIYWWAQYTTFNPCRGGNGVGVYSGIQIKYLACLSPAPPSLWGCALNAFVICNPPPLPGLSCCTPAGNGNFLSCVPPPACAPYAMNFTMNFVQCNYPAFPGCNAACYRITSNWVMTIEGQTVVQPPTPTSSNGLSFCLGGCTNLTATGNWGVPPYTYAWTGGGTTNPVAVCPGATTTYVCTITDLCGITAVNQVTITITGCLPVELVDYKINYENNIANISWETATEKNSDYFTLEKSYDGNNYEVIAKVNAAGNSNSNKFYSVNDSDPNRKGITYYRLKLFDVGETKEKFSQILALNLNDKAYELEVLPNPANNNVTIIFPEILNGKTVYIDIYDNIGRKVLETKSEVSSENNNLNFNVTNFTDGVYFIKASDNLGTVIRKKLVKN